MTSEQPAALTDVLVDDCVEREGDIAHLYLDSRGFVTTGVGRLVRTSLDANQLPFRMGDRPATVAEVTSDFVRVQMMLPNRGPNFYLAQSSPMLPPGYGRDLCRTQILGEFMPGLRRIFPHVDSFPAPAVRALLAMSYALGLSGLAKFTHLVASCNRGDWLAASQECCMVTARPETNERNAAWLRQAVLQSS